MGMHMMWRYVHNDLDQQKVSISRNLVLRVLNYARPYKWRIATMLVMILITTGV